MELLYRTVIPRGRVHCMAWSGMNLIALSVSVETEGKVAENYETPKRHQVLVFDPERPWDFHCVADSSKGVVTRLEWSADDTRLLALDQNSVIHVWRMKSHCINSWVCASKQEPASGAELVHAAWLDHKPMATIHHSKQEWSEVMECQPFSPRLKMLLGSAFICVYNNGTVRVTSTSLAHRAHTDSDLDVTMETKLEGEANIITAKTLVTPSGSLLCCAGCRGGCMKVFCLSIALCWGSEFTVTSTPATEFRATNSVNPSDEITELLMQPHLDGCVLHLCYNRTWLCQWSVKDVTRSGSYQSAREYSHNFSNPLTTLTTSTLCLGSHDPSVEKMSDIFVMETEVGGGHGEEKAWPVEVMVAVAEDGVITLLKRDSYKVLCTYQLQAEEPTLDLPVIKKPRVDRTGAHVACLSPNACCIAVASGENVNLFQAGSFVLGLKDSTTPTLPRCSRMLSLAAVTARLPWDLAVTCCRLDDKESAKFVKEVLEHFSEDFQKHSSSMKDHILRQYFTTCSLLHSCLEDGLLPALAYRNMARLKATTALLTLCLPSCQDGENWLLEKLKVVCTGSSSEESLEVVANNLELKEFVIPQITASQLQGHVHWIIEFSIKVVDAVASGYSANIPDSDALLLLRQSLVLIYVWNKALPRPIIPVTDGALSLLFKVLTKHIQSPSSQLPEELQSEILSNVPSDKYPNLLTLTKAAHIQGFLSGLATLSHLPETFQRDMSPRIRPHIQKSYMCTDPFSPLTLVVPQGLSPPWRDCFVEGQKDVIHGGMLMKTVVLNARLKQCSRCRCWTVASESLQSGEVADGKLTSPSAHPVQQWRNSWTDSCLCGGPWTLRSSKRT